MLEQDAICDVLVIGSGAGGLTAAITAAHKGLDVIVIEKDKTFGGTTAFSGGVLWVPGNRFGKKQNPQDTADAARTYLKNEAGNQFDQKAVDAFLQSGPEAIEFLEANTEVQFVPTLYPDYHPDIEGGVEVGRSVLAAPFNTAALGSDLKRLRPPLQTITFMGMMFNSSNADIKHFFNATKSAASFIYVVKRLFSHFTEMLRYGRGVQVTSGNALAARLAKSAFNLKIPIHTETPALELIEESGRIAGARVQGKNTPVNIRVKRAVVLATGGFSNDKKRIGQTYAHLRDGGEHFSPVPDSVAGDGIALAEKAGGHFATEFKNAAAWMPVSKVRISPDRELAFPHLLDRYKPGIIAVDCEGRRFTNEANSYHDVGEAVIARNKGTPGAFAWLIASHATVRKYGLGFAKPAPVPLSSYVRSGYLIKTSSLAGLAARIGCDPNVLTATVAQYNLHAEKGEDPLFLRGATAFNRYLGDPAVKPNPNVGPVSGGPYYALRLMMGDLGTFDGLATTVEGQVISSTGTPIAGLYAVGNDRRSVMGGAYPGAGITLGPAIVFGYITGKALGENRDC